MKARAAHLAAAGALLLLAASLAGCRDDLTEVVLVVESDLSVPDEVDSLELSWAAGPFTPPTSAPSILGPLLERFPVSIGVLSQGMTDTFSFTALVFRNSALGQMLLVRRAVSDVHFVPHETRMLVLQMPRACACQGTTCPDQSGPDCANVTSPTLLPFDPSAAPPSTMMGSSGIVITPTILGRM